MNAILLDDQGNLQFNTNGTLQTIDSYHAAIQFSKSECRCTEGNYFADSSYGKSPLAWYLSQSPVDRIADLQRITAKYLQAKNIYYTNGIFTIQF